MTSATRIPGHRFLHSPGPTRVPEAVQHAMTLQPMDLADPRVDELIADCEHGLRWLMNVPAREPVFLYACNGHGAWEAVIANLLGPGRKVLIPGTGHFSESWAQQCEAFGATVLRTPWHEGKPIDVQALREALERDAQHEIVAVFAVHTDTASGVTTELEPLRQAMQQAAHPALFVVDVVASLATAPFDMQAVQADAVLGASQKGLMVPPGLGFVVANERARAVARANKAPRYYWDWDRRDSELSYRKFCGTPPHALLAGLRAALGLLQAEGLPAVLARHAQLAGAVRAAVEGWGEAPGQGIGFFCSEPLARANAVTTISVPLGFDPEALRSLAREQFQVSLSGGLGPLAGRVFRIGHLGDLNAAMVLGCLAATEAAMGMLGWPHGPGLAKAQRFLAQAYGGHGIPA